MGSAMSFLKGVGVGAGLMYLLDPDRGRRRRALLRDKAIHTLHEAECSWETASEDLTHRVQGAVARTRNRVAVHGDVPDETLVARVRSQIGHLVSHPRAVEVFADNGAVMLSGPVLAGEVDPLIRGVMRVPGVRQLDHRLEIHDNPGGVPELQGERRRAVSSATSGWKPGERLLASVGGGLLALMGRRQGGVLGGLMSAAGVTLIAQSVRHRPTFASHEGDSIRHHTGDERQNTAATRTAAPENEVNALLSGSDENLETPTNAGIVTQAQENG